MIEGRVNEALHAKLRLELLAGDGAPRVVDAMIDTGFNGFLALPAELIEQLSLSWIYRHQGELANGVVEIFDVYEATVAWDGVTRVVEAEAIQAAPLVGMSLMLNHELRIEVKENGQAVLSKLG
jgi:clan AA aspartic protease